MKSQPVRQVQPAAECTEAVVFTRWFSHLDNRREVLALRHQGYLSAGLIEPQPGKIYTDAYDALPTTILAGLFRRGACLSTLRLSLWTPDSVGPALPCENVYPEVAKIKARAEGPIAELSRLAIDPGLTNVRYRSRLYAASVRAAVMACLALDVTQLLVASRTRWQIFYEHVLGFTAVGPPQFYPPGNVPIVLMRRAVDRDMRQRLASNLFFRMEEQEIEELRSLLPPMLAANPLASQSLAK